METEQRLINATKRIMVTHGVEGCTLERITEAAGFTRGAFYSNFRSKEELFIAVAEDEYALGSARIHQFAQAWEQRLTDYPLPHPLTPEVTAYLLGDLLRNFLEHMQLNREFFILHSEFQIRSARDPEWAGQFADINREFVLALASVLSTIIRALGRQLNHTAESLAQAVIGIVLRANGVASWEQVRSGSLLNGSNTKVDTSVVDLIVPLILGCTE